LTYSFKIIFFYLSFLNNITKTLLNIIHIFNSSLQRVRFIPYLYWWQWNILKFFQSQNDTYVIGCYACPRAYELRPWSWNQAGCLSGPRFLFLNYIFENLNLIVANPNSVFISKNGNRNSVLHLFLIKKIIDKKKCFTFVLQRNSILV